MNGANQMDGLLGEKDESRPEVPELLNTICEIIFSLEEQVNIAHRKVLTIEDYSEPQSPVKESLIDAQEPITVVERLRYIKDKLAKINSNTNIMNNHLTRSIG
jgi:hypothetical protein